MTLRAHEAAANGNVYRARKHRLEKNRLVREAKARESCVPSGQGGTGKIDFRAAEVLGAFTLRHHPEEPYIVTLRFRKHW